MTRGPNDGRSDGSGRRCSRRGVADGGRGAGIEPRSMPGGAPVPRRGRGGFGLRRTERPAGGVPKSVVTSATGRGRRQGGVGEFGPAVPREKKVLRRKAVAGLQPPNFTRSGRGRCLRSLMRIDLGNAWRAVAARGGAPRQKADELQERSILTRGPVKQETGGDSQNTALNSGSRNLPLHWKISPKIYETQALAEMSLYEFRSPVSCAGSPRFGRRRPPLARRPARLSQSPKGKATQKLPCFQMFVPLMPVIASRFPTSIDSEDGEEEAKTVLLGQVIGFAKAACLLILPQCHTRAEARPSKASRAL